MNDFEQRQEDRKNNLLGRADNKRQQAKEKVDRSNQLVAGIPLGQPILVGHHSEQRHRNALEKSQNAMFKSVELNQAAKELERRAAAVGTGGISSDDPEAIEKLKNKLANLEASQELMKKINRQYKKGGWDVVDCIDDDNKAELQAHMNRSWRINPKPYESYTLQNNNAVIKTTRDRIKELEDAKSIEYEHKDFGDFSLEVNPDINRVCIRFSKKPKKEICQYMRHVAGMVFSRKNNNAWQRKLNNRGLYEANSAIEYLKQADLF